MKRTPEEFEIIPSSEGGYLGKGSFGIVKLARDKLSGILHAMKIVTFFFLFFFKMNKKDLFEYCSIDNLKREIRI